VRKFLLATLMLSGCAVAPVVRSSAPGAGLAPIAPAASAPAVAAAPAIAPAAAPVAATAAASDAAPAPALADSAQAVAEEESDEADEADDDSGDAADESESHEVAANTGPDIRYTADLSPAELERLWKSTPAALGSMSVGFVDAGRLVNGERFPEGEGWTVVSPAKAWATRETIAYVQAAIRAVRAAHPDAPPLRVNQISAQDGGYIRPHQSHQNGRDVDLAFYYPTAEVVRARAREKVIDLGLNWALIKSIATLTDVQMILVDKRVQKRLYDYALAHGEDRAWVGSLFFGSDRLIKHARGHRDHFHVRFFNPRAQELGRRVAPLLAQQPEFNVAMHRVRRGDNLGAIARKYGTTVVAIRKANHLKGNAIRAGITLSIPLRGPCVHCAVPPALVLPERRLPPPSTFASASPDGPRAVSQR